MVNSALKSNSSESCASRLRSCLVVEVERGDDFLKALASEASALFLSLGASREDEVRARARASARSLLLEARQRGEGGPEIYVRVAPVESGAIEADLAAVMSAKPDGVLLEEACGGASVQHLSAKLAVHEAEAGFDDGSTRILALAAQTPAGVFALGSFRGASRRLGGLVFDSGALQRALGGGSAPSLREEGPLLVAPLVLARSLLALGAAAAGVAAIDEGDADLACEARLRAQCVAARREGFSGKVVFSPAQARVAIEAFG